MLNKEMLLGKTSVPKVAAFNLSFWVEKTNQTYSISYDARDITPSIVNIFGVPSTISEFYDYDTSNNFSKLVFADGYEFSPNNDWCFILTNRSGACLLTADTAHSFKYPYVRVFNWGTLDTNAYIEIFRRTDQTMIPVKIIADTKGPYYVGTIDGIKTIERNETVTVNLPSNSYLTITGYDPGKFSAPKGGCELFNGESWIVRLFDSPAEVSIQWA